MPHRLSRRQALSTFERAGDDGYLGRMTLDVQSA